MRLMTSRDDCTDYNQFSKCVLESKGGNLDLLRFAVSNVFSKLLLNYQVTITCMIRAFLINN